MKFRQACTLSRYRFSYEAQGGRKPRTGDVESLQFRAKKSMMNIVGKRRDNSLPRGVVILLLTFSLTLDKSAGKLWPRPFVFFDVLPASAPTPPFPFRVDDSAPASVGRGNKEAARYRTSLNLKLKLISLSRALSLSLFSFFFLFLFYFLSFSLSSDSG